VSDAIMRQRSAMRALGRAVSALALVALTAGALGAFYEWGGPARRGVKELKRGDNAAALHSLGEGRQDQPSSAAIRYDQGLAFRRLGLADSARAAMEEAMRLKGAEARSAAAYNLGNEALRQNRLEEAVERYRESLRNDSRRADAKKNLEEVIRRLRTEQQPPPPSRGGGGGGTHGPSGSGGGGGSTPPPNSPPGETPRSPSPSVGGPIPSRSEAEMWLDALESERRSERKKDRRAGDRQEERVRDW
jgi:tetratricopeptide (TPR) repeat protein